MHTQTAYSDSACYCECVIEYKFGSSRFGNKKKLDLVGRRKSIRMLTKKLCYLRVLLYIDIALQRVRFRL